MTKEKTLKEMQAEILEPLARVLARAILETREKEERKNAKRSD